MMTCSFVQFALRLTTMRSKTKAMILVLEYAAEGAVHLKIMPRYMKHYLMSHLAFCCVFVFTLTAEHTNVQSC